MVFEKSEFTPGFFEQLHELDNGVLIGLNALKAAGIQQEFAAMNVLLARAMSSALILRAGAPPVYNEERSPKSGENLTKTSNQGFFRGSLAKEKKLFGAWCSCYWRWELSLGVFWDSKFSRRR